MVVLGQAGLVVVLVVVVLEKEIVVVEVVVVVVNLYLLDIAFPGKLL